MEEALLQPPTPTNNTVIVLRLRFAHDGRETGNGCSDGNGYVMEYNNKVCVPTPHTHTHSIPLTPHLPIHTLYKSVSIYNVSEFSLRQSSQMRDRIGIQIQTIK